MAKSKSPLSTPGLDPEEKQAWIEYAESKGFTRPSDFVKVCLVTYLKQRPPKHTAGHYGTLSKYLE